MTVIDAPDRVSPESCVCGGSGTVFVDDDYVNRHAARSYSSSPDGETTPGLLEALRWTVHPCHECRPQQYDLWAGGHFRPGHTCSHCRPARGKPKARQR